MRSLTSATASADNSGFSRHATAAFSLASGALLAAFGATSAHAQIYTANKTTSAANPNLYFSTTTGASSFSSFAAATHQLGFVSGSADATIAGIGSSNEFVEGLNPSNPMSITDCSAARYTTGMSIQGRGSASAAGSGYTSNTLNIDSAQQGWAYPGSGYLGLVQMATVGTTNVNYFGWASINLNADHTVTLNSFAMQTTPNADILAGAAPAASAAPEPDAVALLALGASGLAAFRLRRKAQAAEQVNAAPLAG